MREWKLAIGMSGHPESRFVYTVECFQHRGLIAI